MAGGKTTKLLDLFTVPFVIIQSPGTICLRVCLCFAVAGLFKGQRQCSSASPGRSQPGGPVRVRAQRQARQGRLLLADGSDRPRLLETQLPHLGE